jgi:serine/threonine protein kinase
MKDFEEIILEKCFEVIKGPEIGGQAEVYVVKKKGSEEKQILKIYLETDENFKELKLNISKEFEMLKSVQHDNIVKAHKKYIVTYNGKRSPAFTMEYVEGDSLQTFLNNPSTFINQELFFKIAIQLSSGLMGCHRRAHNKKLDGRETDTYILSKALKHNDIHLGNIVLRTNKIGNDHDYVLIDFGLSFLSQQKENIRGGALPFCPPEKFNRNTTINTQSDVYSLGVVFYYLLTGEYPFNYIGNSEDDKEVAIWYKEAHSSTLVPSLLEQRALYLEKKKKVKGEIPDIDFWINTLILKCLEKDPSKRFRDAGEINVFLNKGRRGDLEKNWRVKEEKEEESTWTKALNSESTEALRAYIDSYPNSKHITLAKKTLKKWLEEGLMLDAANLAYKNAEKINTKAAFEALLKEYPYHLNKEAISAKINDFNKAIELEREEINFKDLLILNPTKKGVEIFKKKYPNSNFINTIKQALLNKQQQQTIKQRKFLKYGAIAFVFFLVISIAYIFTKTTEKNSTDFQKDKEILNAYYHIKESNQMNSLKLDNIFSFPLKYYGKTYNTPKSFKTRESDKKKKIIEAINRLKNSKFTRHYSFSLKDNITTVIVSFSKKNGEMIARKEIIKLQNNKIISVEKE